MPAILQNMKIRTKLLAAFGLLFIGFSGFGIYSLNGMGSMANEAEKISVDWLPSIQNASDLALNVKETRVAVLQSLIATTDNDREQIAQRLKTLKEKDASLAAEYEKHISSAEERAAYEDYQTNWEEFQKIADEMILLANHNQIAQAGILSFSKGRVYAGKATAALEKDVALNVEGAKAAIAHQNEVYQHSRDLTRVAIVAFLVVLAGALILLLRSVAAPVRRSTAIANELARGNYKMQIEGINREDEIGKLAQALHKIKSTVANYSGQLNAIDKSQAVIEFDLEGRVLSANDNFLKAMGYTLEEIKGKHHSLFVDAAYRNSNEYAQFWEALKRGQYQASEYRRIGKGGKEVWIQASYNPILDPNGEVFKIVKYAADITQQKLQNADYSGQIDAIGKSQAVIAFNMDGTIIEANPNFLNTVGYTLDEIKGKHHSMFVEPSQRGIEYSQFWDALSRGQYQTGEYKRVGKNGREIWIQASYNPILDMNGIPFKVVKYATDVTQQKLQSADSLGQIDAIGKSQAVISFNMDGTIIEANPNFLNTVGYTLDEIKGKHHSMFVEPGQKNNLEYTQFWEALKRGEYQQAEYKRLGKGGKEVWIQASYNPILDMNGVPFKVVKYATDVTQMVQTRTENERGLNEAVQVLEAVSAGSLTDRMHGEYKGAFNSIKTSLNATIEKLIDIVTRIKDSAQSVGAASSEINAGTNDLSQRTEQQASSLEETAASMEQITGTVRQNSENARNANTLSSEASHIAQRGGKVAEDAVGAMQNIEKSSQKISDIITVIDEIAFQTNLLALNAAVEAARAGEAGKGFAVVASEVRSLAGRSASASKEIKTLIMESNGQVKTGAALVNQAGDTLKKIVSSVKKVASIISEIAAASAEQATGIDEINAAISQMDEVTQQNAALVEENNAAAQSLVHQAQALDGMMRFFKVNDEETNSASRYESPALVKSDSPATKPMSASSKRPTAAKLPSVKKTAVKMASAAAPADREWEEF